MQNENDSLKKKNDRLKDASNKNDDLVKENVRLKKKVDWLTNVSHKLTQGKENLDKLLGSQRLFLFKSDLRYDYKNHIILGLLDHTHHFHFLNANIVIK